MKFDDVARDITEAEWIDRVDSIVRESVAHDLDAHEFAAPSDAPGPADRVETPLPTRVPTAAGTRRCPDCPLAPCPRVSFDLIVGEFFRFRVQLLDVEPPMYRRFLLGSTCTFRDLHRAIQHA